MTKQALSALLLSVFATSATLAQAEDADVKDTKKTPLTSIFYDAKFFSSVPEPSEKYQYIAIDKHSVFNAQSEAFNRSSFSGALPSRYSAREAVKKHIEKYISSVGLSYKSKDGRRKDIISYHLIEPEKNKFSLSIDYTRKVKGVNYGIDMFDQKKFSEEKNIIGLTLTYNFN